MVQLQADLEKIRAANIQLVAISYDPVEVLAVFSSAKDITFPLLSDLGSTTIEAYGILNKELQGVPYPGTFVIDNEGVVRAKLLNEGFVERHSSQELIEAAAAIK